ncbi:DUF1275 domain-containing protein [Aliidiomarina shirensis]|uniref:DUF1275 domain-containing protein n=1 Tax=Aliidiomarina shirensis TaxID=1048642 RepID=A0A432WSU6_9GAMM|nr:YoaK family protein [Aliidiomarina shirensis]RUO36824.1 DUF1275 domain-containing protein [Aliidiomarina shirensis]
MLHQQLEEEHDLFMQQSRVWVFSGAALLALIAGYINVVMLGFFQVPVSHMSGAVSQIGIDAWFDDWRHLVLIGSIVGGFFLGAFISGLIVETTTLRMSRRYGVALLLEGIILIAATALALSGISWAVALASMACGLQNAMAGSYRGLTIRTTHVTGIVTDLGALIGNRLRHRKVKSWKLGLLITILSSFFIGGLLGALTFSIVGMLALGVAAIVCLLIGAAVVVYFKPHSNAR